MKTLQYEGCTLDVFEDSVDELMLGHISDRIRLSGLKAGETMVRHTFCDIPYSLPALRHSLDGMLEAVDTHFTYLAASIGARVVNHTWGLIKRTPAQRYCYPELEGFGINDYLLGARVEILPGRPINTLVEPQYKDLQKKLSRASMFHAQEFGWTTDADYINQFTTNTQNGVQTLVLHDIEPRVSLVSSRTNLNG